jgi:tetratricopeptide (TPR) repeat protein
LYYDGQAYPQAIEYYTKALEVNPKNPDVITDLGTAYWYSGNPDKAIDQFQKSLSIRPNHPGTLFNMGIVKWQGKKDPNGAVVAWEQLLKSNPGYPQKDQVQMLIERAKMHGAGATKG